MPLQGERMFCCPRCGEGLPADSADPAVAPSSGPGKPEAAEAAANPPLDDGWDLGQQLQHIERVLGSGEARARQSAAVGRQEVARLDLAHPGPAPWHPSLADKTARTRKRKSRQSSSALAVLTWAALSLGTTTFVCGGILLGWSLVAGRQELWTLGLPIALGGQIALLIGLVLQLDRLWHDSRHAAAKLDDVDEQLHDLKTATTMLGTSHSSPASAFYSHLSHGASPQLLLADLKSQLDLLAVKIGQAE